MGTQKMKIAKKLKAFGGRLLGKKHQPAQQGSTIKLSIVHVCEQGRPVRVALNTFQPVVAERRKIPTGTIKSHADKLQFIGMDENSQPVCLTDPQMHAHMKLVAQSGGKHQIVYGASNTADIEQIYADADLAKAMSSNGQVKVVVRTGGDQ